MRRFIPILFLSLFHPVLLIAQPDFYRLSKRITQPILYKIPEDGNSGNGNEIVREIAKHVLREPWMVRLDLSFTSQVSMGFWDGKNRLRALFLDPVIQGDILYRQFDISDVLIPSHLEMTLRWASRYDSSSFTEQRLVSRRISLHDSILFEIPVDSFDPSQDTILLRDICFSYDSIQLSRFRQRRQLIDDYYASSILLDSLQLVADTIDISNPALLPLHFIQVEEINKVLARINTRNFSQNLPDSGFDPRHLVSRYNSLYKVSRTLTYNYVDALLGTGAVPWDGNLIRIADFFTSRMLSFVWKSQLMDDFHGELYRDYLDHYFEGISFPADQNILESLLRKMYPDAGSDTVIRFVSQRIMVSYRQLARFLMEKNQYAEAISLIENAKKFVAANPVIGNFTDEDELLIHASTEIYNAYVGIASGCIRNQKYQMADDYLAKASEYRSMHPDLIPTDSIYRKVYSELFFMRNSRCDDLLDQKKYEDALGCYRLFEQTYSHDELAPVAEQLFTKKRSALTGICSEAINHSLSAMKHDQPDSALFYFDYAIKLLPALQDDLFIKTRYDSVAPFIGQIRYKQLFTAGRQALERRQFTLAIEYFDQVRLLKDQFRLTPFGEFDSLYRKAMKNHLLIDLSTAMKDIWASRFGAAEASLEQIRILGSTHGLAEDPEFDSALNRFREKIGEQKCRDLNDSVTYQMICADRNIALKNFRNAAVYMKRAVGIANSIAGCGLPTNSVTDSLKKYAPAVIYQENIENARKWVASGGYDTAINILYETEKMYRTCQLEHLGCVSEPIFDFVSSRNNPYLTFQAIQFYQAKSDDREAFRFLTLLQEEDFQSANTKIVQEELGRKLAQLDFLNRLKILPEKGDKQFPPVDKWFRVFKDAYQDEWNRLIRTTAPVR
jgi:tetratricopeptide (TPR) repeat protein